MTPRQVALQDAREAVRDLLACATTTERKAELLRIISDLEEDARSSHAAPGDCTCRQIQTSDPRRHFRGCAKREPLEDATTADGAGFIGAFMGAAFAPLLGRMVERALSAPAEEPAPKTRSGIRYAHDCSAKHILGKSRLQCSHGVCCAECWDAKCPEAR